MRTIHKYVLPKATNKVSTFMDARFLHVANQHEQITVWAEVDTLAPMCQRTLFVVGTGNEVPPEAVEFIGSALLDHGNFVFHVYAEHEDAE